MPCLNHAPRASTWSLVALLTLGLGSFSPALAQLDLVVGPNVNLVSGGTFPDGDPFLRQQNEPTVAFSVWNNLHLLAGANDYRAVDVPGVGGSRETGDSWLSYFFSTNGGSSWKSTLIPGYPQDPGCPSVSPLCNYAAGADPVIRAGADGMFFYTYIVFDRVTNKSAIAMSRFVDLNNDPGGEPIRFIDTVLIDTNEGDTFLDKSWLAVGAPPLPSPEPDDDEFTYEVDLLALGVGDAVKTVQCGPLYVGYAAIAGEGANLSSEIRLKVSTDCGSTWGPISGPGDGGYTRLSQLDTLNQGTSLTIDPISGAVHVAWRRFDTVEAFLGLPSGCPMTPGGWESTPLEEWTTSSFVLGNDTFTQEQALDLLGTNHRGDESIKLAYEVIAAYLNLSTGGGQASGESDSVSAASFAARKKKPKGDPTEFDPHAWVAELEALLAEANLWFESHPVGSNPKQSAKKAGQNIKKAIQAILLGSGECFDGVGTAGGETGESNAILVASSSGPLSGFGTPKEVVAGADLGASTFDQGSSAYSFRTTAYPSIAADANGRIYLVWAARGFASARPDEIEGDSRIVLSYSTDGGMSWSPPYAIDDPATAGHQIKPSLLFAGGELTAVYYDFRQDVSGLFERFVLDLPLADRLRHTVDVRLAVADVSEPESGPEDSAPIFDTESLLQVSRYPFLLIDDAPNIESALQLQWNPTGFPMFGDATVPFHGDYVDVAAGPMFVQLAPGEWDAASQPGDVLSRFAVWTDTRDVKPPPDGDWSRYVALPVDAEGLPISGERDSIFDPTQMVPDCNMVPNGADYTGTRNQNVYGASISRGVIVAAPGNSRPLEAEGPERGFVVYVQNVSGEQKTFTLTLYADPSIEASFDQEDPLINMTTVVVPRFSGAAVTVFASVPPGSGASNLPIEVAVAEGGTPVGSVFLNPDPDAVGPAGSFDPLSIANSEIHTPAILNPAIFNPAIFNLTLAGSCNEPGSSDQIEVCTPAILNPAILNPAIFNPAIFNPAILNPAILNPAIFNPAILNPAIFNPAIFNPAIFNPAILNPAIFNSAILNPAILNPAILNPAIFNPAIFNPAILNPAILNPAIFNESVAGSAARFQRAQRTEGAQRIQGAERMDGLIPPSTLQVDANFQVTNQGNVTTAYTVELSPAVRQDDLSYQILVYRLNVTPVASGCTLSQEAQQVLVLKVDLENEMADRTFYLDPGDTAFVTFRVLPREDDANPLDFDPTLLGGQVISQSPDTGEVCEELEGESGDYQCDPNAPPLDFFGVPPFADALVDGNGDLEEPEVTNSAGWDLFDSESLPGWTVEWAQSTIDAANAAEAGGCLPTPRLELLETAGGVLPATGDQFAELDTDHNGPDGSLGLPCPQEWANVRIYQDVELFDLASCTYDLSFYWQKRTATDLLEVSVGAPGSPLVSLGVFGTATGALGGWNHSVLPIPAALGGTTRIQFEAVDDFPDSTGMFLDGVRLDGPICGGGE